MKIFLLADGTLSGNCQNEDAGWQMHLALENMNIEHRLFYHSDSVDTSIFTKGINYAWGRFTGKQFAKIKDCYKSADEKLFAELAAFKPDLIIALKAQFLRKQTIQEIKRRYPKIKIVNHTYDNIFIYPLQMQAAPEYDIFYIADSYVVEKARRAGCSNARFMAEPCSVQAQYPLTDITPEEEAKFACDISIVGSLYPYRALMLEALRGSDFKMWGNCWGFSCREDLEESFAWQAHQGSAVAGRDKLLIFCLSKINLTTLQPVECIHAGNERIHQTAACKGFQLVEYNPDLEKVYNLGEELITFKSREEMRELADHYIAHPEERAAIAEKAFIRATTEHTCECRIKEIIADVEMI